MSEQTASTAVIDLSGTRDALAWTDWDEEGEGRPPAEIPLPGDLPPPGA